jgi:hypothetical protein
MSFRYLEYPEYMEADISHRRALSKLARGVVCASTGRAVVAHLGDNDKRVLGAQAAFLGYSNADTAEAGA